MSANDKDNNVGCAPSNESVSSQCKASLVTCTKSCTSESADGISESVNDVKCLTVSSTEKDSRNDRRQRREKRPDIQRYVPKPKQQPQQQPQHDLIGGSAATDISSKSSYHRASDQKKGNALSCKSAAASLPQSTANLASVTSRNSEHRDNLELIPQSHQSESASAAEHCNSKSTKSSAETSLPHSFGNMSLKTTDYKDSSKRMPDKVKQKVSKRLMSESNEPKQATSECFVSALALRKTDSDKRVQVGDTIRSERLDWNFDDEFEYNYDGVSWGDLPPPSDHDWSDVESHDDVRVHSASAANTQKQKSRKPRGNRRRGAKKNETESTKTLEDVDNDVSERKLTSNSVNSSIAVQPGSFESTKLTTCRFVEDRESPIRGNETLSKNHEADDHCSGNISMKSNSHLLSGKYVADKPHLATKNEAEQRTNSKEQRQRNRNTIKADNKHQSDANFKESGSKREENTRQQRPDSGRVGGIIHLPVGTVTAASHNTVHSPPSQVTTSARGRNRRQVHGASGSRALWSPDKLQSLSAQQRQGSPAYEQTQLHAAYPADYAQYYQRQLTSPQLYYAEYPPASGASQMPAADGYVYGYPPVASDGIGYVDDSYYH